MQTLQRLNLMGNLTAITTAIIVVMIACGSSPLNAVAAATATAASNVAFDGSDVIGVVPGAGAAAAAGAGDNDGGGGGSSAGGNDPSLSLNDASTTPSPPPLHIDGNLEFSAITPLGETLEHEPCNVHDASHNDCIKGLFQLILPKLKVGLPAYNLGSIDPYYYRRGIFRYSNDGIAGGLLIKNMNIHGISKLKVHNVQSNFNQTGGFIIKLNLELPKLRADGQFKADVKLGGLRLVPKGPFNITIDHVKINMITDGSFGYNSNGVRNLQLSRLNANVALGNAHIEAKNIFSDPNLNERILGLVNLNLPEITRIGIPATREQWAPILVTHVNEYFENVPIDKFLQQ